MSAKAFDTSDQNAQSQSIAVYVNNEDNILPTGFIAQPYAGQSVSGTVQILISASDNIGVSSVDLYINGENIVSLLSLLTLTYGIQKIMLRIISMIFLLRLTI